MTRLFRPETAFFLLVWVLMLLAFRERGFYDPGALWHVKVGEIILTEGMPQTDPFSFTFAGESWVPQQWGAEVLMTLAHRAGGLDTMLLAFATGIALLATLIFCRSVQGGMGPLLAALMVGVCLFVGAFHYYVRPHMFTIALLAWTMMCIVDYERGRCSLRRLARLVPLYVVWTNLHGGVLGGTMTLGLAVFGWGALFLLVRLRELDEGVKGRTGEREGEEPNPPTPFPVREGGAGQSPLSVSGRGLGEGSYSPIHSWPTAFALVGIVIACLLAPLVNPHGLEMIRIWQRIVGSTVLPNLIHEHMPMDPTSPLGLAVIGLGAFYIALLLGTLPKCPHVSWLIPLVWFALSFKGIRQAPLFAIVAAVAIADLWQHTIWHRLLVKYGDGSLARQPSPPVATGGLGWAILPALVAFFALALQVGKVPVPVIGYGWARFDANVVPADLTPAVQRYVNHPGTRIYNDTDFGGYLIYHAPNAKIFMDDRCELYGDEWIQNYADTMDMPPDELGAVFEGWHDRYQFDFALIRTQPPEKKMPPIERYLLAHPERWREVARGKRGILFERIR